MDKVGIEGKINELVNEFSRTAKPQLGKLNIPAKLAQNCHKQLEKKTDSLKESLDYLRVCIKYQLFDLEATRRENKYLRKILDEKKS